MGGGLEPLPNGKCLNFVPFFGLPPSFGNLFKWTKVTPSPGHPDHQLNVSLLGTKMIYTKIKFI